MNNLSEKIEQLLTQMKTDKQTLNYIKPESLPNIDLYMDQVTTFMDAHLAQSKRYPEDKILTKTMINNYAKNNLLPPPEKKKYSKDHMLLLTFIYYFKNMLSMNDIQSLLEPIKKNYYQQPDAPLCLEDIYQEIFKLEETFQPMIMDDIFDKFTKTGESFVQAGDQQELLQLFAFICSLCYDIYLKKQLVEKIIDFMEDSTKKEKSSKDKKKDDK